MLLFLNLSTQWHRAGMSGQRTGIDYAVIPAVAGMLGFEMRPRLLTDLRIIEHEALTVLAARA